jgi:hypothetical protein
MHAQCDLVCGTLFHHAVEMILKAGLLRERGNLNKMRHHHLKSLWKAFKKEFPDPRLTKHDQTISRLDKFEEIRYPDVKHSIGMSAQWSGPLPGTITVRGMSRSPRQYALVVDDIDALMADVIEASSWNPPVFASTNRAALTALRRHNKHWRFLIRGSKRRKRKP